MLIGVVAFTLLLLVLAILKTKKLTLNSDFGTFWQTGHHFFEGQQLYAPFESGRDFIYPPFAAFCFQLFAILPLRIAACLIYVLNGLLFPASILLLYRIIQKYPIHPNKIRNALWLTAIFSAKYFWSNLSMFQMNAIVFFLVLWGIYFWAENNPKIAGMFFVLGTFIKVTPVFFLIFLILGELRKRIFSRGQISTADVQSATQVGRKENPIFAPFLQQRTFPIILLALLFCLFVPMMQRGWDRGTTDLQEYYHSFLQPFQEGRVVTTYKNQNLAASVYRMFTNTADDMDLDYQWFVLEKDKVRQIIFMAYVIFSLALLISWLLQTKSHRQAGLYFFAMLMAYTHLISGISWSAHLVSFLLILLPFFLIEVKKRTRGFRVLYYFLFIWIVFAGLVGKDTMGNLLHHLAGGYNLIAGLLVFLFFFYLFLAYEENRRSTHTDSPITTGDKSET